MSQWKDATTTRQVWELHMVVEGNQWILESPMIISKTGSPNASTATSMDTWQRNANQKRRNEKHERVSNTTRRGI